MRQGLEGHGKNAAWGGGGAPLKVLDSGVLWLDLHFKSFFLASGRNRETGWEVAVPVQVRRSDGWTGVEGRDSAAWCAWM